MIRYYTNNFMGSIQNSLLPSHTQCNAQNFFSEFSPGVPFNISSYALLTHMVAHVTGLEAGDFVHTFGDLHIYSNHLEQVRELLSRDPLPLPRLEIVDDGHMLRGLEGLLAFRYEHLDLVGYKSHGKIEAPVAV